MQRRPEYRVAREIPPIVRQPDSAEQVPETIPEQGAPSGRGVGALTIARTLRGDNLHIATGQLGYHVLDTMAAIEESAERHQFIKVTSTVDPSPTLRVDFDPFAATL
jgi:hypothetical protein